MPFRRQNAAVAEGTEGLRDELASIDDDARSDVEAARRALALRHQIGIRMLEDPAEDRGYVEPVKAPIGPDQLPEVQPEQLTAEVTRGAILDRGCLLIRGLLSEERALELAGLIEDSLDARDAVASGDRPQDGQFGHFEADSRWALEERQWVNGIGGIWTVDSPFTSAEVFRSFDEAGLSDLIRGYMREEPVLSVQKATLRKASPNNEWVKGIMDKGKGGGWHQDGRFLGQVKALNVWISLSRCGDVAPGMDLVPRRLEEIAPTGTEGAPLDWAVAPDIAAEAAGDRGIVRPIFEPGDVLLFDEMFLHSTATEEGMPNPRYAIETWFFGSSAFPQEYAPVAL